MPLTTLVLGGYGNFGARICRALAGDPHIQLLVGGRNAEHATRFASTLGNHAVGVAIDMHSAGFVQNLRALGVGLVIHTAGPFQGQDYAVARAVAAAGAHYIDLADGRRFVCDFPAALQQIFQQAGRIAITGASTVPALSSAVVDHLCVGWSRIDAIETCIAPAQTAPRGQATLAAVLSYCGKPIEVWNAGQWQVMRGWAQPVRVHFQRLHSRLGAVCDIPDLELFPSHYRVGERVLFRAAVEVEVTQRAFAVIAWLHAKGLLKNPVALAGWLNSAGRLFDPFGSALGGMVLRVQGLDAQGAAARRVWHIAADHDHGPEIPCMAAILLARRLALGEVMQAGARACMGLLRLEEFLPEFARWGMVTDVVEES